MAYLTAEDLLAGSALTHDVEIPPELLSDVSGERVKLRPLTVRDVQLVAKAARDDDALMSVLMVKEGLVEPSLTLEQVQGMGAGLARFVLQELNRVSGLATGSDDLGDAVQAPLARACFVLAREFGWSPQEVGALTIGQILLYLEMLGGDGSSAEAQ